MANVEKIIKNVDTVLNCIPVLNTINSLAQGIYKLAHKVDTLNPVAPGFKTSLKIHVLSKENSDYWITALPIIGNLIALVDLVLSIIHGFKEDLLMNAVLRSNAEVVHLCLGNNPLHDPDRADDVLRQSAHSSNNETFKQALKARAEWSSDSLLHALNGCWTAADRNAANANDILDYWVAHRRVVDAANPSPSVHAFEMFLKNGKVALAERVLEILPEGIHFRALKDILLNYSCVRYDYAGERIMGTGVLTEEQRHVLIAKSTRPSLELLKEYYGSVGFLLTSDRNVDDNRKNHFDTLNKLLDRAQFSPDQLREFIARTLNYDEFTFIEPLVAKYEEKLTPQAKVEILGRVLPSDTSKTEFHEKRARVFKAWIERWKGDISGEAHNLYEDVSRSGELHIEVAQSRFHTFGGLEREYPSVEQLQAVNAKFQKILRDAFPGCDQAPAAEAV
jgi:hypothetical protein